MFVTFVDQKGAPFTRTAQIKKEQEEFEHQKQQSKSAKRSSNQLSVKLEPKMEPIESSRIETPGLMEEDDDDDYESSLNQSFDASTTSKNDELTDLDFTNDQQELLTTSSIMPNVPEQPPPMLKYIPRLNRSSNTNSPDKVDPTQLCPDTWTNDDVIQFLTVNDCSIHCESFSAASVDGKRLLELTKDDIITLLGMKVGPALKIYDLIQQLKCRINPKLLKGNMNKKFL